MGIIPPLHPKFRRPSQHTNERDTPVTFTDPMLFDPSLWVSDEALLSHM